MDTLGWLFILVALAVVRGLTRGRTLAQVPQDLGNVLVGVVTGDTAQVKQALTMTGPNNVASVAASSSQQQTTTSALNGVSSGQAIVNYARTFIGVPYKWGGTTPNGFDCSGFTQYVYKHFGYDITRTTYTQVLKGKAVTKAELEPGDLVFPTAGHVQIYSGNGNVIEAPHTGANVREVKMWGFWKARRILSDTAYVAAGSVASNQGDAKRAELDNLR